MEAQAERNEVVRISTLQRESKQAIDERLFAFNVIARAEILLVEVLDGGAAEHVVVAHDQKGREGVLHIGDEGRLIAGYEQAVDAGIFSAESPLRSVATTSRSTLGASIVLSVPLK